MKSLRKDRTVFSFFVLSFLLIIVNVLVILVSYNKLPPQLPLLYCLPWGEDQLVSKGVFILLPLLLASVLTVNSLWTIYMLTKDSLLARIIMASTAVAIVLSSTTIIRVILLTHL